MTAENAAQIIGIGRSRWKIENEQFNVHKNHGYELEHNYGHGRQTLSMVFYLLNLLAFLAHKVLEFETGFISNAERMNRGEACGRCYAAPFTSSNSIVGMRSCSTI
ncbi:MAG: hypothetical protein KIT57_14865 [Blastocatellales bacterium]|nr:hypothetical protein [Blastocatellales bacterium]